MDVWVNVSHLVRHFIWESWSDLSSKRLKQSHMFKQNELWLPSSIRNYHSTKLSNSIIRGEQIILIKTSSKLKVYLYCRRSHLTRVTRAALMFALARSGIAIPALSFFLTTIGPSDFWSLSLKDSCRRHTQLMNQVTNPRTLVTQVQVTMVGGG